MGICWDCRKRTGKRCSKCGQKTVTYLKNLRVPKKDDVKKWKQLHTAFLEGDRWPVNDGNKFLPDFLQRQIIKIRLSGDKKRLDKMWYKGHTITRTLHNPMIIYKIKSNEFDAASDWY